MKPSKIHTYFLIKHNSSRINESFCWVKVTILWTSITVTVTVIQWYYEPLCLVPSMTGWFEWSHFRPYHQLSLLTIRASSKILLSSCYLLSAGNYDGTMICQGKFNNQAWEAVVGQIFFFILTLTCIRWVMLSQFPYFSKPWLSHLKKQDNTCYSYNYNYSYRL